MRNKVIIIFSLFLLNFFSTAVASTQIDIQDEHHVCHPVTPATVPTVSSPLVHRPNLYDDIPGTRLGKLLRWSIGIWGGLETVCDTGTFFLTTAAATCNHLASCDDDPDDVWSYSNLSSKLGTAAVIVQAFKLTAGYAVNKRKETLRRLWIERTGIDPTITTPGVITN